MLAATTSAPSSGAKRSRWRKHLLGLSKAFIPSRRYTNLVLLLAHSHTCVPPWPDTIPVLHRCHGFGSSAGQVGPLHPSVGCSGRPVMLRFGADTPGWSPGVFARYHGA